MTQFTFDCIDDAVRGVDPAGRGLIPEQELDGGTFVHVCSYAGGEFYMQVTVEDSLWNRELL